MMMEEKWREEEEEGGCYCGAASGDSQQLSLYSTCAQRKKKAGFLSFISGTHAKLGAAMPLPW